MKLARYLWILLAALLMAMSTSVAAFGYGPGMKQVWGFTKGEANFGPTASCFETTTETAGWLRGLGWLAVDTAHCTPGPDGLVLDGEATFTAWNGDEFFATYTAETVPLPPPLIIQEVSFEINGGTGRFEGAFGSFQATLFIEGQFDEGGPLPGPWKLRFAFSGWLNH